MLYGKSPYYWASSYYQVYTVVPTKDKTEDDNCEITTFLWGTDGNGTLYFHNKTDSFITIDKNQSFFIVNNHARSLFKGISVSNSSLSTDIFISSYGYGVGYGSYASVGSSAYGRAGIYTANASKSVSQSNSIFV